MEQKKLCTITGFVGEVTRTTIDGKVHATITVATTFAFEDASNELIYETSWHDIKLREGKYTSAEDLNALKTGSKVSITGRVSNEKFTRDNGKEMSQTMIVASALSILDPADGTTVNRIELVGRVGSIKESVVSDTSVFRFSLATNRVRKNQDGEIVLETTWHNAYVFSGEKFPKEKMSQIKAGTPLSIVGRLNYQSYTALDGETRRITNIVPVSVEILEPTEPSNFLKIYHDGQNTETA